MISLTFSPAFNGSSIIVRAAFFRICADLTLRGPESSVVATYSAHSWKLGARSCHQFACDGVIYLRVTNPDGTRERLGPYELLRAADGGLFTEGRCLGTYCPTWNAAGSMHRWHEIALLAKPG